MSNDDAIRRLAAAITPNVGGNNDATGGHVESLTEAVMGVTSGLCQIASSLSDVAEAIRFHAHATQGVLKDFDHQICMGIRHGLFGSGEATCHAYDLVEEKLPYVTSDIVAGLESLTEVGKEAVSKLEEVISAIDHHGAQ